jgi:hypothetical protein
MVSDNQYDAMAEEFEKKEHELFGEDGFEKMAQRVACLEQAIGIYDLKQFTPHTWINRESQQFDDHVRYWPKADISSCSEADMCGVWSQVMRRRRNAILRHLCDNSQTCWTG